jgi:hypothetical protein
MCYISTKLATHKIQGAGSSRAVLCVANIAHHVQWGSPNYGLDPKTHIHDPPPTTTTDHDPTATGRCRRHRHHHHRLATGDHLRFAFCVLVLAVIDSRPVIAITQVLVFWTTGCTRPNAKCSSVNFFSGTIVHAAASRLFGLLQNFPPMCWVNGFW